MVELAEKMSLDFDAVVVLSGDGGVHEVINGLSKHSDANKAVRIPIAQVPTGSANAVCLNILGPKVLLKRYLVLFRCLTVVSVWVRRRQSMPECDKGYVR
jgi:Diacylglycerol kinase catalytic domain